MWRSLINRFGLKLNPHKNIPPVAPTLKQEWQGVLGILALIFFLDRFSTYIVYISFGGFVYLLAIVFVACRAGLRSALGGCVLLVAYSWIVYHYPISAIGHDKSKATAAVIGTAIFFPVFAITAGVVQNKLRAAAIREYEAREVAHSESEHRKIAEAELWASEEMRHLIINSSVDAVIGLADDGVITMWNPNAEKLFGWTQSEATGSHVADRVFAPETPGEDMRDVRRFFEPGQGALLRRQIEFLAQTKSGDEVSVEFYIADHKTDSGSIYIVFARDISDRKRAEQAIHELNSKLEERVADRTAQLEAANSELIGFTYSVSHDLRAPLRAIVSNSRIVCEEAKGALDEETYGYLKRLESNALKMSDLIENLLHFARIGQVALNKQEVDLSALADGIARELQTHRDGSIVVQPGMVVKGDPEMIKMVMFNLMENAWKYVLPNQFPKIEVGATESGAFFVRDEGIGFDMKYADKVWEPFERLHRDSEYPGTGIGLANSKRIIVRHGGKMWAESAPGEGTTMYFEIREEEPVRTGKKRARYAS